jgi:predicted glycosyltransferase involved in capsule biosynthesis
MTWDNYGKTGWHIDHIIPYCKFDFNNLPSDFEDICNEYEAYNINNNISINPYLNDIFNISTLERDKILENILKINRPGRGETDHQKVPLCGGICMFRKDAIIKIGGWNEEFWSWGGEDDFVSVKVKNFLNYVELPNKCYHLYHSRENPDMRLYQRNLQILQKFAEMSKDEMIKTINQNTIQKMGMKNKCDNF